MRWVLLVGGCRDGDRVQVQDDTDYVRLPGKLSLEVLLETPLSPLSRVETTVYKLERFQAGTAIYWVGYPNGTHPEHGLSMLLAGYVGNS